METRTVGQTKTVVSQLMLPTDANPSGQVHGGAIMKLVDTVGGVVAMRHSRLRAVTARMDEMSFLHPVFVGDLLILKASVNNVGRTSMEVGVRVEAENLRTGVVTHTASAYMLYVALDDEGKPTEVPRLVSETEDEVRRKAAAQRRKAARERPPID